MCGLYGVASSSLTVEERNVYYSLAVLSCLRGTDSTGCAAVTREKGKLHVRTHKTIDNPVTFVESREFERSILNHNPLILMGHSREATIGTIHQANAHPFRIKHLIGMHNGTIPSLGSKNKTDSEELYEKISEKGLNALNELTGAYALSFFNIEEGTLNFYRNYQRPLFYMIGGSNLLVWASEWKMLDYVRKQHPILATAIINDVEAFVHHYVNFDESRVIKVSKDDKALLSEPPETKQLPFIPDKASSPLLMYPTTYPYRQELVEPVKKTQTVVEKTAGKLFMFRTFNNNLLTVEEYRDILAKGCCNCERQGSVAANNFFIDQYDWLCPACQKTHEGSLFMHSGSHVKMIKKETRNA